MIGDCCIVCSVPVSASDFGLCTDCTDDGAEAVCPCCRTTRLAAMFEQEPGGKPRTYVCGECADRTLREMVLDELYDDVRDAV